MQKKKPFIADLNNRLFAMLEEVEDDDLINYKDGMRKRFSNGVAIFLHEFSNDFVSKSMDFKETRRGKNGLALFFLEDTGTFQLFDMQKIRAAKLRQPLSRRAPDVSIELPDISNIPHSIKKSSITNSKDDDWDFEY